MLYDNGALNQNLKGTMVFCGSAGIPVDIPVPVCYDERDNFIPVSWQVRRLALPAEQDNRVRIPNGTAAVNAELEPLAKAGHWKKFREGRVKRWKLQPFL